jgi:hypothetical protein
MKRFGIIMMVLALGYLEPTMGVAGGSNADLNAITSRVQFQSQGKVRNMRQIPVSSVRAERFHERQVEIFQLDPRTRFVILNDENRTDLEFWTLEKLSGWRVIWHAALAEEKPLADQDTYFAGVVPQLVQIGPKDFAVGVLTSRSTGYSGGGGMNTYLNLYRVHQPTMILSDSLVTSDKLIRACFSEADYNSGRPCHDEYSASSTLKFFGSRHGLYRLKKLFSVAMLPTFRRPSDPSGDTPQSDRIAVCSSYALEYVWNPAKQQFESLWPEPSACEL